MTRDQPENGPEPKWANAAGEWLYLYLLRPLFWLQVLFAVTVLSFALAAGIFGKNTPLAHACGAAVSAASIGAIYQRKRLVQTIGWKITARSAKCIYMFVGESLEFASLAISSFVMAIGRILLFLVLLALAVFILGGIIGILVFGFRQII